MRPLALVTVALAAAAVAGCQTLSDVTGIVTSSSKNASKADGDASANSAQAAARASGATSARAAMKGMSADELRSLWGEPVLKRAETGAELWQYGGAGSGCTLLVYLYPGAGEAMTVSRAEAVPGGADEAAVAACAKAAGKPPLTPVS